MRLLNSSTLELEDFYADRIPAYVILSHTWGEGEVSFADMERGSAEDKAGYEKIQHCCKEATRDGCSYAWVDTCCIDKNSSAELSEAINSMYTWYQKAEKCYAYLADVPPKMLDTMDWDSAFANSGWFKRGWTLQELIGPENLVFFSKEWTEVGTKSTLQGALTNITGIDLGILIGTKDLESASVAKRMSWASHRKTTRPEDIAYCLMGLFDVNMPMLYGEGSSKAFLRLQEEIMKKSDDHSLFAWTSRTTPIHHHHGLLATSPGDFAHSRAIVPYNDWEVSAPFSMSNKGLRIDLRLSLQKEDIFVAALDCPVPPAYEGWLGIYLKRVSTGDNQYTRVESQTLCKLTMRGRMETVYVRQSGLTARPDNIYPLHFFQLQKGPAQEDDYKLVKVSCSSKTVPLPMLSSHRDQWMPAYMRSTFEISKAADRLAGALLFEHVGGERLATMLGSTTDFGVGFDVAARSEIDSVEDLQRFFRPQAPGTNMVLENHQVRVNAEPRIFAGNKYYMVDIVIETINRAPPKPIDLIRGTILGLEAQPVGHPQDAKATGSRIFRGLRFSRFNNGG